METSTTKMTLVTLFFLWNILQLSSIGSKGGINNYHVMVNSYVIPGGRPHTYKQGEMYVLNLHTTLYVLLTMCSV